VTVIVALLGMGGFQGGTGFVDVLIVE